MYIRAVFLPLVLSILETVDNDILFIIYDTMFFSLLYFPGLLSILRTGFYVYNHLTPNYKVSSYLGPAAHYCDWVWYIRSSDHKPTPMFSFWKVLIFRNYVYHIYFWTIRNSCIYYWLSFHYIWRTVDNEMVSVENSTTSFSFHYEQIFPSSITLLTLILTLFEAFYFCI